MAVERELKTIARQPQREAEVADAHPANRFILYAVEIKAEEQDVIQAKDAVDRLLELLHLAITRCRGNFGRCCCSHCNS